uniref:Uncharacterized protein n=1 Tax=Oryza punctata TaxID=4537 RepID=A0A0E0MJB6_ORYPU
MAEPPAAKVYYEGCPGCAIEQRKEEHKGIPYKEFLFVAITTLASSLPISSLFPFLYFMPSPASACLTCPSLTLFLASILTHHHTLHTCLSTPLRAPALIS